jgi:UDP-2,3-diacylglucosamine pyrophosphatase LpxH
MIAVVADAHIGERAETFSAFRAACAETCARGAGRFVVLGDLFRFFIGLPGWASPEQVEVLEMVRGLKEAGVRTAYVEGNRDFFLRDPALAQAFDFIGARLAVEEEGRRYVFMHGDGLNRRDRRYRLWRAVSKSGLTYGVTRLLPRRLLLPVYRWAEARLKGTNFQYRKRVPEEDIRAFASALTDADALVLGHFHQPFAFEAGAVGVLGLAAFRETGKAVYLPPEAP